MSPDSKPPLHFGRNDPKLLGETLIMGAHYCFVKGDHAATYDCNGQWLRLIAGGNPFRVDVFEIRDGERPVFSVLNTGDGLTTIFHGDDHGPITKLVIQSAREQVHRMKHSL